MKRFYRYMLKTLWTPQLICGHCMNFFIRITFLLLSGMEFARPSTRIICLKFEVFISVTMKNSRLLGCVAVWLL
jgi:hypothetical protein